MRKFSGLCLAMSGMLGALGCGLDDVDVDYSSSDQEIVECPYLRGDTGSLYPLPDCDGGGGGGGGGSPPPPPAAIFKSSVGVGGSGAIRDLKFEKADYANQTPLPGYHLIPADLNKGAGGTYIYLTFTRDDSKVQARDYCNWGEGGYTTRLKADDFNWFDSGGYKGVCVGMGNPWTPIWEYTGNIFLPWPWKHPDLNDGAGGRYIFAWQAKVPGEAPILEVGVVSGSSSSIQCPSGWTRDNQDLNQGAGGDYIYFCVRK